MFTKREIREIAEDLVEDLREAPDGYCITSAQLLRQNGYDLKEFGEKGLFYFHQALDRVAKANHIDMDMSAHDGKEVYVDPTRHCNDCGEEFRSAIIGKKG